MNYQREIEWFPLFTSPTLNISVIALVAYEISRAGSMELKFRRVWLYRNLLPHPSRREGIYRLQMSQGLLVLALDGKEVAWSAMCQWAGQRMVSQPTFCGRPFVAGEGRPVSSDQLTLSSRGRPGKKA